MNRIFILVEGQTEETFVRNTLSPHLNSKEFYVTPILVNTKIVKSGLNFKGGVVSYGKVRNDILRLLKDTNVTLVTTFFDFYGLPSDFPNYSAMPSSSCYSQVAHLESAIEKDINDPRFLPYLALHEFEAMLFVAPDKIVSAFPGTNKNKDLHAIKNSFASPEEINNNPDTAPSKRITKLFTEYRKTFHGPLVTNQIGLDQIRNQCPHFNQWLEKLENLSPKQ